MRLRSPSLPLRLPLPFSVGLILFAAAAAGAQSPAPERERFLSEAEIVDRQLIQTGITLPQVVTLRSGDQSRRAAFKSFEIDLVQNVTVVREEQQGLRDSWRFEVAAYELDKLLELGMVPVTVVREIDGQRGALIDWVDGVLPDFETSPDGFSMAAWRDQVEAVWLFDYLAYNIDRTSDNLLVAEGFKIYLIDHSRAFQGFQIPMRPLRRFPRAVIERLRELTEKEFRDAFEPYLEEDAIDAFMERRKHVLERVDRLLESRSAADVYF